FQFDTQLAASGIEPSDFHQGRIADECKYGRIALGVGGWGGHGGSADLRQTTSIAPRSARVKSAPTLGRDRCRRGGTVPKDGTPIARKLSAATLLHAMPMNIRSKLPVTGTTIFTVMSALAQKHGAVNLGQGFPDYPIDPALIDLVTAAMRAGHNQYPLMPGVMGLREAIAAKVERLYARAYDPQHEVTVTTGATQAIYTAIQALAHAGDEVIVFEPAYDSYIPSARLAGATPVPLALSVPDYRIDWTAVARAVTPRTRIILINTPNNPGTSVLTAEDRNALATLVRGT